MIRLWSCFLGYARISLYKIIWVFLFACVFYTILQLLQRWFLEFQKVDRKKEIFRIMLSIAFSLIFVMTLFGRAQGEAGYHVMPFQSHIKAFKENDVELILQIIMNIILYIPLGFLLPCSFEKFKKVRCLFLVALTCSFGIELIQGFLKIGLLEIDDVINNVFGAMIGLGIYMTIKMMKKRN